MPLWGNDDGFGDIPKFPLERQVRSNTYPPIFLTVASTVLAGSPGNNSVTFTGANSAILAGVANGMFVYDTSYYNSISYFTDNSGQAGYSSYDFFTSNNRVINVSGNVVTLSSNVLTSVLAGNVIAFAPAIAWSRTPANTYNQDTILITATRTANATVATGAIANVGNLNAGWNKITKKVNNDGTIRYLKETLVALANGQASNTFSGNTSFGTVVAGL